MYEYKAIVTRVIDGDTFIVDIDLGFYIWIKDIRIRLLRCDTPEIKGIDKEYGLIVKDFVKNLIEGKEVIIKSEKSSNIETDSFGRWLAAVEINHINLADYLTKLGVNKYEKNYSIQNVQNLKERV